MKETTYNNLSLLYALTIEKLYTCTLWTHFHLIKFPNWATPIWRRRKRCMQGNELCRSSAGYRPKHKKELSYAIKSSECCFNMRLISMLANIRIIYRHMLSSERKITFASSGTFVFIITTLHSQLKWLLDEMRGCKTCQEEGKKITKGRQRERKEKRSV